MVGMIVDCAIYRDGRRTDGPQDLSDALAAARASGDSFLWMGLHEPTEQEFALVTEEFGLHPLAVEDAVRAHQRPKVERYQDSLFVVLKTIRYRASGAGIDTGELMLFLGDSFVLTVRHGSPGQLGVLRHELEQQPEILRNGPAAVLYTVCDTTVDDYLQVATELQADLDELEADVFAPDARRPAQGARSSARGLPVAGHAERIYGFKRQLLAFRRGIAPLVEPMGRLANTAVPYVPEHTRPYLRDVADHLVRANEQVDALDRLLSDILSANLAQVSVQQNNDMRKISAWAALAAVPTMIAGVYGMNFEHMPELSTAYGYPVALSGMALVCVVLHRVFKRSGWL